MILAIHRDLKLAKNNLMRIRCFHEKLLPFLRLHGIQPRFWATDISTLKHIEQSQSKSRIYLQRNFFISLMEG